MEKNAADCPRNIAKRFNDTNLPRCLAGETSAIYMGANIDADPTANPAIIRLIINTE